MNYYERHIGDRLKDTVGLSMLEDGAYDRLLDQYYQTERPLPLDMKEVYRLARATSTAERKAVDYVVSKFFSREEDGFHQKRCDEAIEAYWDREPAEQSKRENDRERQRRARERRKALFEELRKRGIVPEFNTPTKTLQAELSRVTARDNAGDDSDDVTPPVTRDNTLTQAPVPTPQSPDTKENPEGNTARSGPPTARARPAELSAAMRRHSVEAQPGDPRVIAAADAGVTVATVEAACAEAKSAKPNERINAGYVLKIATRWTSEAASPRPDTRAERLTPEERRRRISDANAAAWLAQSPESDPNVIDMEH